MLDDDVATTVKLLVLLAAPLVTLGLSVFVLCARPAARINQAFAGYTALAALWGLSVAGSHWGVLEAVALRSAFATASLIPAAFLAFVHAFPARGPWPTRAVLKVAWGVGAAFACLSVSTALVASDPVLGPAGFTRRTGPLYPVFAVYCIAAFGAALVVLVAKWRAASGLARAQLHYLGAGASISIAGGVTSNLLYPLVTGRSTYSWLGPCFFLPFVILVSHAIIRLRLMDLRFIAHRSLTVAVATAVSLTPVGAFLVLAGPRFTRGLDGGDLIVLILAIAAATLLVSPTRDVVTRVLDRYLYRTHASVGTTLREASNALTRVLDLDPLLQFVGEKVSACTEAEGVAIYVEAQDELRLAAERFRAAGPEFAAPSTLPGPLRRALVTCGDCVVTDEVVRRSDTAESRQLHGALQQLHWALLLPLVSARKVIGAIAVGPKLSGDPFYPHDLDLLMTLANQAGIAVKNAQLYTEVVVANEHLQNIVSTIESGVVAVDRAGRVSMFNPAAERLTGIPSRAVQGHPLQDLPPALAEPLRAAAAEGQARAGSELALPGEGAARSIMGATAPLRDPAGGMLGAVTVLSDLTAVKALESERRRAERLAQFEVLAASIAHEIKNPLVAIKTFAQLLTRKVQGERFVDEFGRVVTREIGRMERLVDRLRMLARPSDRPRQVLDLRRPVREAVEFLQPAFEEKRIALAVEVPPQAVLVEGDASELEALVVNLLLNAHEVTPPEGVVRIGLEASGQVLRICIDDSGPGIPPEAIERIFDPFYSTKPRGSGLGLTICAGIAAAHHAKLRASNKPAGGALFTVEFSTATLTAPVGGGASTPA